MLKEACYRRLTLPTLPHCSVRGNRCSCCAYGARALRPLAGAAGAKARGGGARAAYRLIMLLYAAFIGLWLPLNFWMMPWHTLRVGQARPRAPRAAAPRPALATPMRGPWKPWWWGALQQAIQLMKPQRRPWPPRHAPQVYLYSGRGGFKVMERKEVERQAQARPPPIGPCAHALLPLLHRPTCSPPPLPAHPALRAVTAPEPCLHACGFRQSAACSPGGRGEKAQERTRSRSSMLVGAELALLCA